MKYNISGILLQPPIQDFYDTDIRLQPIGLAYLKAVSMKYHPDIPILIKDYHQGFGRKTIPIPKELLYLKRYYGFKDQSAFSSFHHYFHFGASFETIVNEVKKISPTFIGISSLFSPYFREVKTLVTLLKQAMPDLIILLGGSHISALKERILEENPQVDFIITGEGEKPFVEFVSYLKGEKEIYQVPSLGYRDPQTQKIALNPFTENFTLDEIPYPNFEDLNKDHYQIGKKKLTFLITSRSCPHRCSFCSVHQTFGTSYRRRSVDNVIEEIKLRVREGYEIIDFEDDNLTFYLKEMKELCKRIIEEIPSHIEFVAMNGISYLGLDDELLKLMKRANFTHLNLALVTSDKVVRETTKRPHTISKYIEITEKAHQLGFKITSYQILGLPQESLESMVQTLTFNAKYPVLLGASLFYLTPYSPISKNFPVPNEKDIFLSRLTSMAIENYPGGRNDIYTLFITTRIINFVKGLDLKEDTHFSQLEERLNDPFFSKNMKILKHLLDKNELLQNNKTHWQINREFKSDLFSNVWNSIDYIMTRNGHKVILQEKTPLPFYQT